MEYDLQLSLPPHAPGRVLVFFTIMCFLMSRWKMALECGVSAVGILGALKAPKAHQASRLLGPISDQSARIRASYGGRPPSCNRRRSV